MATTIDLEEVHNLMLKLYNYAIWQGIATGAAFLAAFKADYDINLEAGKITLPWDDFCAAHPFWLTADQPQGPKIWTNPTVK